MPDLIDPLFTESAETVEYSCWLPRRRRSAGTARRLLREFLAEQEDGERFAWAAQLILSELFGNAVQHARTPPGRLVYVRFGLALDLLRVEVHDASDARPRMREVGEDAEQGRGLALVARLAVRWGCCPRVGGVGKAVWAVVGPDEPVEQGGAVEMVRKSRTSEDSPVVVEIQGITAPATFRRLPDAVMAVWESLRALPLGSTQYEAYKFFMTRPDAVERINEFLDRDGQLDLSFSLDNCSHAVRFRRVAPSSPWPLLREKRQAALRPILSG